MSTDHQTYDPEPCGQDNLAMIESVDSTQIKESHLHLVDVFLDISVISSLRNVSADLEMPNKRS